MVPVVVDELARREIAELRRRIRELEIQLADTRSLVALSNERLAAPQQAQPAQFDGLGAEATDIPPSESEVTQPSAGTTNRETTATPTTDAAPAPHFGPEATAGTADVGQTPDPEHPLWESVPWPTLALAPTLALPLLFLGWMRRRRKYRQETPTLRAPVPETSGTTALGATIEADPAEQIPAEPATTPNARTLASYGGSGDPDREMEEADLVSEADLYIAYGRYHEAETLLEKAREKSPHRPDVEYKLIEAYYGLRDRQRMEILMDQMRRTGDDRIDPDQWQRLNTMLEELKDTDTEGPHLTIATENDL